MTKNVFDAKTPGSSEAFSFNFVNQLAPTEFIQSATAVMSVKSGVDIAPNLMVRGPATVSGSTVTQIVGGGLDGNYYFIDLVVITNFQTLPARGVIPVAIGG